MAREHAHGRAEFFDRTHVRLDPVAIGIVCAGGGLYFVLVGLGLTPPPSKINGPNWLGSAVGLVFFAAGLSVLVRGWLHVPDKQPNCRPTRPRSRWRSNGWRR